MQVFLFGEGGCAKTCTTGGFPRGGLPSCGEVGSAGRVIGPRARVNGPRGTIGPRARVPRADEKASFKKLVCPKNCLKALRADEEANFKKLICPKIC